MARTTWNKVTFLPFPKLSGNDCTGGDIIVNGKREGAVCRVVEWRDVGHVSASYRPSVTGYTVTIYDGLTDDRTFDTLAEARGYARDFFVKKGA